MESRELMHKVDEILDDAKAGLLATVAKGSRPRMRWMTPIVLAGRPGLLYAVTMPGTAKLDDLEDNGAVEWLIQTRALTEVVTLRGQMRVVDNPAMRSEIMETLASRLGVFWRVHTHRTDWVVLETRLQEGQYFQPMKGRRETVKF